VNLTNGEFNLLTAFIAAPQRVLSRDELLGLSRLRNDDVYERSIDTVVARLRRKLGAARDQVQLIATHRSVGYVFCADVEIVR
jgi:Response regulators consisting of a CheY-like receiver domain and a winged-helix DNA-binding domain